MQLKFELGNAIELVIIAIELEIPVIVITVIEI